MTTPLSRLQHDLSLAPGIPDSYRLFSEGPTVSTYGDLREVVGELPAEREKFVMHTAEVHAWLSGLAQQFGLPGGNVREVCSAIMDAAALNVEMRAASHRSAPDGCKCSDCTISGDPCPACYRAWWSAKHPNIQPIESSALSAVPPSQGMEPDMRKVAEALGFEPDNHHNALKCPYCNPQGLTLAHSDVSGLVEALERARAQFHSYAEQHKAKGTADGDAKALTNAAYAEDMQRALAAFQSRQEEGA